ncbi:hypothetical protein Hanom_Chr12g01140031 [Helianthus anomalus]
MLCLLVRYKRLRQPNNWLSSTLPTVFTKITNSQPHYYYYYYYYNQTNLITKEINHRHIPARNYQFSGRHLMNLPPRLQSSI